MSNFEAALILMDDRWISSLEPAEDFQPSKKHEKAMKKIFDKMRGDKYHRLTRKSVALLVAAAILISAITVIAANKNIKNQIVETFDDYSIFRIDKPINDEITSLEVGYIPDGFNITESESTEYTVYLTYERNDKHIEISKNADSTDYYFDSEEYKPYKTTVNDTEYVIAQISDDYYSIMWNNDGSNYNLEGNLPLQELLKIAISTK